MKQTGCSKVWFYYLEKFCNYRQNVYVIYILFHKMLPRKTYSFIYFDSACRFKGNIQTFVLIYTNLTEFHTNTSYVKAI